MAPYNPRIKEYPLIPAKMVEPQDIDPATLEIFKTVLESPSGRRWLEQYIIECVGSSHIIIRSEEDRIHGYIKSHNTPYWADPVRILIKQKDSWLKKWIKRQLM